MSRFRCFVWLLICFPLAVGPGCGDDDPVDGTPPAAIDDLVGARVTAGEASLAWSAPGDDGNKGRCSDYDIRLHTVLITDANWNAALVRGDYPATPQSAGNPEVIGIMGIPTGDTYYAAIKAVDDAGNWSGLSNVVELTVGGGGDNTPPGSINDLAAVFVTSSTATLAWTATGDDGASGTATSYEITYDEGCDGAPQSVASPPTPRAAGLAEEFTVTGLTPATSCCFTLRAVDDNGNRSPSATMRTTLTAAPFEVVDMTDDDRGPDWSPDGLQIAFGHLVRNGQMDIYIVNVDGSRLTQVTSVSGFESTPDWRPLHAQLAFRADWGTMLDIHMIDTDGTDLTRVIVDAEWNSSPAWSPDGTMLAFTSRRDGNTDVWTMDVSGGSPGTMAKFTDDVGTDKEVAWSPDGRFLALIRNNDVWVVSYPGEEYTQLTSTAAFAWEVAWSHDSAWIAFVSDIHGSYDIFVVHRDGGELYRVTYEDARHENQPSWLPVPSANPKIVYSAGPIIGGDSAIWVLEVAFD